MESLERGHVKYWITFEPPLGVHCPIMIRTIMIVMMVVVVMILVRYYNVGDVGCDGLMMVMMMVRYC